MIWFGCLFITSLTEKKLIVKYLSEPTDYKQYCDLGKNNVIFKPPVCPHCKSSDCLIGHSWYARKGLSGADCDYVPFWIRRFYCKNTGKTISMHPCFSHTRKRYTFQHVIDCLTRMIENLVKVSQIVSSSEVPRQTLNRWFYGFSSTNCETKRICYRLNGPPESSLGMQIFDYFRKMETGTLIENLRNGMVLLFEEFYTPLY